MSEHCRDRLAILSDYLDGDLDAELCVELEQHLAECGNCRIMVDTLHKTIILYRNYGHEDVPQDIKKRLYKVLHLERERPG